jgi:hypothetical protein
MRRLLASVGAGLLALVCALFGNGVVSGATAPNTRSGGTVEVFLTPTKEGAATIVVTGAIGDYGKTQDVNQSGRPDETGNFVKVTLKKGSFEVDQTALNQAADNPASTSLNAATCSAYTSVSSPVELMHGSRLYEGISGTVDLTITSAAIGSLDRGQCNTTNNAQPIAQFTSVTGSGTVTFSQP